MRNGRFATPAILIMMFVVASAGGAAEAQHGPAAPRGAPPGQAGFAGAMHAAMANMAKAMEAAPLTGDPDRDFLAMMIPHHEGAVEMARLVLVHGRDPLVRRLAEEIFAGQQTEIAAMRERLAILRAGRDAEPGGFPALGGTRGPAIPAPPPGR